ncbi:MAG TPA: S41 family peptidase [Rhizomicrobium sp.]|nr:S41 family peptidase [Rhizomicrobium sp.]
MKQFVVGAVCGAACIGLMYPVARGASDMETYKALDRFSQGFSIVRHDYVQPQTDDVLVDKALQGMAAGLDPHSSYMTQKEFEAAASTKPTAGIGLELTMSNGLVQIITPIEGTPADKAGVKSGDFIAAIDGKPAQGMSLNEAIAALRGDAGSKVTLTLLRTGAHVPMDITMTRVPIVIDTVRYERKGDVGYIRISSFNLGTDAKLKSAVDALKKQIGPGLKGYIVDLRGNPGGLLDQGVVVSDDFLDSGEIVSTKGRNQADNQTYRAKPGDITDGKPIVVLINESSAAASEIVAAALQDNHRATIVGMHSFGVGTVQTIIPVVPAGGAFRLTTSQFFTPSGRPIQVAGVTPDVAVSQTMAGMKADPLRAGEAGLRGHIDGPEPQSTEILYPPAGKQSGDYQLSVALERLASR